MPKHPIRIKPGETIDLELTESERSLLLNEPVFAEVEDLIRSSPPGEPIKITLPELDFLCDCVGAAASDFKKKKTQKKILDGIDRKCSALAEGFTDGGAPSMMGPGGALSLDGPDDKLNAKFMAEQMAKLRDWLDDTEECAREWRITTKPVKDFWLAPAQRDVLLQLPECPWLLRRQAKKKNPTFTVLELLDSMRALVLQMPRLTAQLQMAALLVAKHLAERLFDGMSGYVEAIEKKAEAEERGEVPRPKTDTVYQFTIVLVESDPPIWRRIQVIDCTLDKLHEHIQMAMGWTNSHLHQFRIEKQIYADPGMMEGSFMDFEMEDSTHTLLSEVMIPQGKKKMKFQYEYDF